MIYDYGGFPEHTYHVQYPAPGSPELASEVRGLLEKAGIACASDEQRGFDHGTFVPLAVAYPDAKIPVVQLSMRRDYDPAAHLAVGRAIASLRDQGILIIGSGSSYHDLSNWGARGKEASRPFDDWLTDTVTGSTGETRTKKLLSWTSAPCARRAHPQEIICSTLRRHGCLRKR